MVSGKRPRRLRKPVKMALWFLVCCVPVLAFGLFCQWLVIRAGKGALYTDAREVPEREVALVLGTSERLANGRKNRFFTYRIDAAAELYREGKVRRLLLSGDKRGETYDEPARMKEALMERGVPESALVLDGSGFRTLDSVFNARDVFGVKRLVIVSQRFHNQRALFIADHAGMEAIGFCARDLSARRTLKVRVREALARVRAVFDLSLRNARLPFPGPPKGPVH